MQRFIKSNLNLILVILLALIPIILWILMSPLATRFASSSATMRSLGQVTGLLGMALLSINFILAARFKFLDKLFNGLNRAYIKHHIIGAIAFCLLLFHPTFLAIQYLVISLKASFNFIFSFNDLAIILGEVALLVFIVLMMVTFYFSFKYQNWKNTHKFLGIVLIISILHMLHVSSDISNNKILNHYMFGLAFLGIFSYFYRTIFAAYKKGEYPYKLKEVIKVNDTIVELKFTPLFKKIKFLPGQFVFLRFDPPTQIGSENILAESHPFSIISAPADDELSLGIKTLGDYSSMVYLLKAGATCRIEGPFGAFSYQKVNAERQIWVAGGIGITPFLSMARQIDKIGVNTHHYKIDLYYVVKNNTEAAFADEFMKISQRNDSLRFYPYFSDTAGRISANFISENSKDIGEAEIFLCGPLGFMQSLREQFRKLGVINNKIHSEEFSLQE